MVEKTFKIIKKSEENNNISDSRKTYNIFAKKYREIVQRKKKEAHMQYYEAELLYILVNHFKKYEEDRLKYKIDDTRNYPRKIYHQVLMDHSICRDRLMPSFKTIGLLQPTNTASASFSILVKRMERGGWIKKFKVGKRLYLKISEKGLKKIIAYHEFYKLNII